MLVTAWNNLKKRVASRQDSEHEQTLVRLIIGVALLAYFHSDMHVKLISDVTNLILTQQISLYFLSISVALYLATLLSLSKPAIRRISGIILDVTAISAILTVTDGEVLPIIVLYPWVIIGNAMRYGNTYMLVATVTSLAGIVTMCTISTYWSNQLLACTTLIIGLITLPFYLGALLKRLNTALDEANNSVRAKSQFIAHMSHELRTPLNGVIGMADLLKGTNPTHEQTEYIETINTSAYTLLELIENILDVSKLEAQKMVIETTEFDLHKLVNEVSSIFEPQINLKNIKYAVHTDPEIPYKICGDPLHLKQVLMNLMSNAIKFTRDGGVELRILCEVREKYYTRVCFKVIDTGIGIPLDAQTKIFDSFQQADASTTRKYGGTGLGTTISKELVKLMGGDLRFQSKPGIGSTFYFSLPFKTIQTTDDIQESLSMKGNKVLLLCSDNLAEPLQQSLDKWEIDHTRIASCARIISMLLDNKDLADKVHSIIIENHNIEMEIQQFSMIFKSNKKLKHISLIAYDKQHEKDIDDVYFQAGIDTVLHAPFDDRVLFNALHVTKSMHKSDKLVSICNKFQSFSFASEHTLKILVAEDNKTNQMVIEKLLTKAHHNVTLANDGKEVLDYLAHSHSYDLIILDMNMPYYNGLEILNTLSYMNTTQSIPTIVLTADTTVETRTDCKKAGANAVITKPIDSQVLFETISQCCQTIGSTQKNNNSNLLRESDLEKNIIINLNRLENIQEICADPSFFVGLVETFYHDVDTIIKSMEEHIKNKNVIEYKNDVHGLKSIAGNIGANYLYVLASQFLDYAKDKSADIVLLGMEKVLLQILEGYQSTQSELHQYIRQNISAHER